jgi:hypothetical protein
MKFTPRSSPKETLTNRILELAMVFVTAFAGTYITIFFAAGKSHITQGLAEAIVTNQLPYVLICLGVATVITVGYFIIRSRKVIAVSMEFDDTREMLTVRNKPYYSNAIGSVDIPYAGLDHQVSRSTEELKIDLYCNSVFIGSIDPSNVIWEREVLLITDILKKLKEIKAKNRNRSL